MCVVPLVKQVVILCFPTNPVLVPVILHLPLGHQEQPSSVIFPVIQATTRSFTIQFLIHALQVAVIHKGPKEAINTVITAPLVLIDIRMGHVKLSVVR